MTKQRLGGLIGLLVVVTAGVWWTQQEPPHKPAPVAVQQPSTQQATVQQLNERIAALEKRLAELETSQSQAVQIWTPPAAIAPEQRGERYEINGLTYYVQPLGEVSAGE